MAGGPGFEPRLAESESAVLPLNYSPAGFGMKLKTRPVGGDCVGASNAQLVEEEGDVNSPIVRSGA